MIAVRHASDPAPNDIVVQWLPLIRQVVSRMRIPANSLDDFVQEAVLSLLRRYHAYDPARSSLPGWVRFMTRAAVLEHMRARGAGPVRLTRLQARRLKEAGRSVADVCVSLDADGSTPWAHPAEPHTDVVERRDFVGRAVAGLPARERAVVDLLFPRDGSLPVRYREAGRRLRISESRVAQIWRRAQDRLRSELAPA